MRRCAGGDRRPLMLAACGGGGGSSTGSRQPEPSKAPAGQRALGSAGTVNAATSQSAVGDAGRANPQYGSVYQQVSTSDVTTATFDASSSRVGLTVGPAGSPILDLNSQDHSIGSTEVPTPVTGHTSRSWGLAKETPTSLSGAAVFVSWDSEDTADWLAGGYWLHATGNLEAGTVTVVAGAFVDGPEFEDRTTAMPTTGTATYSGVAGGIWAYGNPAGDVAVGEVLGTVSLTANFGSGNSATIEGAISGIGNGVEIALESTTYESNGRINAGNIGLTINNNPVTGATGKWGGRFSNKDDNGQPRRVAGTAGAEWTESNGNRGAFVGAFVAQKQ